MPTFWAIRRRDRAGDARLQDPVSIGANHDLEVRCRARMFYWFNRGEALLRYEVRKIPSGLFQLAIVDEHGKETVDTFDDEAELHARQIALAKRLSAAGWTGPHGWNL
jgi:hypothetical protein